MSHLAPCPDETRWQRLRLGLEDDQVEELTSHLEACSRCAEVVHALSGDDAVAAAVRACSTPDADDAERLIERLKGWMSASRTVQEGPTRNADDILDPPGAASEIGRLGEYHVLKLLGTGGMGAVYLARHARLSRLVALKVGLAGSRATRFRREAEAVARLRHRNIVGLYEVGEHKGHMYFAMEYVEGGSLSRRLAERVLPARQAAELVADLAEATHYAHTQGVVHRDLKPANVLLSSVEQASLLVPDSTDKQGCLSYDGKIADFGLAKVAGSDIPDDETRAGAVLGTPSYMAPEQAESSDVGPAVDVYGLGAILYECLTGKPPFRAETPLETLHQVRQLDPVAPRSLRPNLPRDLDTVCLKCLEKTPSRRYGSAMELADDLRRFLDGRPTLARPVGPATRLAKWARRRPLLASLTTVCLLSVIALVGGAAVYESRLRGTLGKAKTEGERADGNYKAARDALKKMLERTLDRRWNDVPRLQHLQREQREDALAFFEGIARQQSDDPSVRQDVAWALLQVGKVQSTLGRAELAKDAIRRADRLTEELLAERPDDPDVRFLRADVLMVLATTFHWLKPESIPYLEKALALLEQMAGDHPEATIKIANTLVTLGGSYHEQRRYTDGERCLLRAIDLYGNNHPIACAKARLNLAAVYRQSKQGAKLTHQHERAEAEFERLYAKDPADRDVARSLALLRINRAYDLSAEGKSSEAFEYVSRNVPMLESARRREPDDIGLRDRLHATHGVRATMLQNLGRIAECVKAWEEAMALATPEGLHAMRYTHVSLLTNAGEFARAETAADTLRDEIAKRPPNPAAWGHLAGYYDALAKAAKDEPMRTRCREKQREAAEQAEKFNKLTDSKKHYPMNE